ncbi:MAG TPA: type II toxin-antitoxin system HipA family toxin [Acidobacteriaceae bacterium]|nr:type II toxin-antitoxin system HipA family toxin [Acidobacteriaceae bacterium]
MATKRPLAQLAVWLGKTLVGHITELPNDSTLFVFDQTYAVDRRRPVLSLSFYGAEGNLDISPIHAQMKLSPFFSNLLPEGELRNYLASMAGVKKVRDLPLLQMLGEDLPGAVVVRPEGTGAQPEEWDGQEVLPLPGREEVFRFSLAGVQMKFSGSGSPQRGLTIPAGGRGGHWILKLPSRQYPQLPENEHSMMQFAAAVGIQVAETGLVPVADIEGIPDRFRTEGNALWGRRFDRTEQNGRIHMEDFNQLYSQMPASKYDNYGYGNMAFDLVRISGLNAVAELVRRLVFNAAIGNADMHLKNWTLLYRDGRTPELSPAYDLVSTIAYIDDFQMALSFAREKDIRRFDKRLLQKFAEPLPIPAALIIDTAEQTAQSIVDVWPRLAPSLPMPAPMKEKVQQRLRSFPLTAGFLRN